MDQRAFLRRKIGLKLLCCHSKPKYEITLILRNPNLGLTPLPSSKPPKTTTPQNPAPPILKPSTQEPLNKPDNKLSEKHQGLQNQGQGSGVHFTIAIFRRPRKKCHKLFRPLYCPPAPEPGEGHSATRRGCWSTSIFRSWFRTRVIRVWGLRAASSFLS